VNFGQKSLVLFTPFICIVLTLIVGPILRDGMFLDGLVYTNIAINLSNGVGSFWAPLYSKYGGIFYEHPPLLMYIESIFFSVFGDSVYVEDLYNTVIFVSTIYLIYIVWKLLVDDKEVDLVAFPLLFFVLGQEVQLRYPNTMLECGMTLIILISLFVFLKTVEKVSVIGASVPIGLGAFLAFLCKGPAGLFILSIPALYYAIIKREIKIASVLIPAVVFILVFGSLFFSVEDSFVFINQYVDQQVLAAIKGQRVENIAPHRLRFIELLFMANLPAIILGIIIKIWSKGKPLMQEIRIGIFFITIGLLAIFPLIISIKQASYYQIPSLPFFVIGFSILLKNKFSNIREKLYSFIDNRKWCIYFSGAMCLLCFGLAVSKIGKIDPRDVEVAQDSYNARSAINLINPKIDKYQLMVVGSEPWKGEKSRYGLIAYLARYQKLYLASKAEVVIEVKTDSTFYNNPNIIYQDNRLVIKEIN